MTIQLEVKQKENLSVEFVSTEKKAWKGKEDKNIFTEVELWSLRN
jgi:hypothetical protein